MNTSQLLILSGVVDPQLRVHGVDGLREADASVMPAIVRVTPMPRAC